MCFCCPLFFSEKITNLLFSHFLSHCYYHHLKTQNSIKDNFHIKGWKCCCFCVRLLLPFNLNHEKLQSLPDLYYFCEYWKIINLKLLKLRLYLIRHTLNNLLISFLNLLNKTWKWIFQICLEEKLTIYSMLFVCVYSIRRDIHPSLSNVHPKDISIIIRRLHV